MEKIDLKKLDEMRNLVKLKISLALLFLFQTIMAMYFILIGDTSLKTFLVIVMMILTTTMLKMTMDKIKNG